MNRRAFDNAQRRYDAMQPPDDPPDPTENMDEVEYGAALVRWMHAGAPSRISWCETVSTEESVRRDLIDFLNGEKA